MDRPEGTLIFKMENILEDLAPLAQRTKDPEVLNSVEDMEKLGSLIEDIHDAAIEYQVRPRSSHPFPA